MAFTYMLRCGDGTLYVGSTRDLGKRVWEHRNGFGGEYTSKRQPVTLIWAEEFDRIDEAYALEKRLQGWGRAKRLAFAEGRYADLPALARKKPVD